MTPYGNMVSHLIIAKHSNWLNNNYYGYINSYSNQHESEVSKLDNIKKVTLKWQNESVEGAPNNKKGITEFLSKEVYEYSDDFNKSEYL